MEKNELVREKKTLILTSTDISKIAKKVNLDVLMTRIIAEVEKGFLNFQKGNIKVPKRRGIYFTRGLVEVMPAFDEEYICYKIGSVYKNNRDLNLPSTLAHLVLVDRSTGYPFAFIEATLITALRTGAASGVATKYLAREDSKSVGIIGAGVQAYTQLHAIALVSSNLKKVYVYDKVRNHSDMFFKEYRNLKIQGSELTFIVCSNPKELCRYSDIIVTATTKSNEDEAVVKDSWVKEGAHINAIGTDIPKKRAYTEIDLKLLKRSKVIVDYKKQALGEGEAQNLKINEIYAELGEIVLGEKKGRTNDKEITVFDSTGVAFQDLVTAKVFIDGHKTIKFCSPKRIDNPYAI